MRTAPLALPGLAGARAGHGSLPARRSGAAQHRSHRSSALAVACSARPAAGRPGDLKSAGPHRPVPRRCAGRTAAMAQPEGGITRADMNVIYEKERKLAEAEASLVGAHFGSCLGLALRKPAHSHRHVPPV